MALNKKDGKNQARDNVLQRTGMGTITGDHVAPGSITGSNLSTTYSPFNKSIKYGGGWSLSVGGSFQDFLSQSAVSNNGAGDSISFTFTGTSLTIMGSTFTGGGYGDVYIDGKLAPGRLNTYTFLSAQYALSGLNATDTTISVNSTTGFAEAGKIQIDGEVITYTGKTAESFTGCTRSGQDTHITGSMVYGYGSGINFYSPYMQSRIPVWSNATLTPGTHTVVILGSNDLPPSSSGMFIYFSGFVVNGLVGASNISTMLDYIKTSVTFDAAGNGVYSQGILSRSTDRQILGILGAAAYQGFTFFPCYFSWRPDNQAMAFSCPSGAGKKLDVIVTLMVVGASI